MDDRTPNGISVGNEPQDNDENQEDFATLLESSEFPQEARVRRDTKVKGAVVSIGRDWVFVDIGAKSEGHVSKEELVDDEGNLTVKVGDELAAYVVSVRPGEILLSVKMTGAASEEAIRGAFRSGVPIEGVVQAERKGGYTVAVFGKTAFCPYSQIDLPPAAGPEEYVSKRLTFRIMEYSEQGRNIVLSRRQILEEERLKRRDELKKTLQPGDIVSGTVQKIAPFGAFVDLGGVDGLIPLSELAWYRVADASEVVHPGQELSVRILDLDWENNRLSLSLKQTLDDPWQSVLQRYPEGSKTSGTVTRLMQYGAFVEIEPGVEGLVHISNLGTGKRVSHPREVVAEGENIEVRVLSVDPSARRIGLELCFSGGVGQEAAAELREGDVIVGTVDSVKDYGVFLSLPEGKSGLLHVSEIAASKSGGDLRHRFPLGSTLEVEVVGIDPASQRISLSTKRLSTKAEEAQFREYADAGSRGSFGKLGDLLKDKLKK